MSPLHRLTKLHMLKLHMISKNGPVPGTLKKEADFQNFRNYVHGCLLHGLTKLHMLKLHMIVIQRWPFPSLFPFS